MHRGGFVRPEAVPQPFVSRPDEPSAAPAGSTIYYCYFDGIAGAPQAGRLEIETCDALERNLQGPALGVLS